MIPDITAIQTGIVELGILVVIASVFIWMALDHHMWQKHTLTEELKELSANQRQISECMRGTLKLIELLYDKNSVHAAAVHDYMLETRIKCPFLKEEEEKP
jgi:hypothetical protein